MSYHPIRPRIHGWNSGKIEDHRRPASGTSQRGKSHGIVRRNLDRVGLSGTGSRIHHLRALSANFSEFQLSGNTEQLRELDFPTNFQYVRAYHEKWIQKCNTSRNDRIKLYWLHHMHLRRTCRSIRRTAQ